VAGVCALLGAIVVRRLLPARPQAEPVVDEQDDERLAA
jgi:hypothetical protein